LRRAAVAHILQTGRRSWWSARGPPRDSPDVRKFLCGTGRTEPSNESTGLGHGTKPLTR
jgi:hypothetical protein